MLPPIERLIREAVASLPCDTTCDDIAAWIISRRLNTLRIFLAGCARQALRRYDEEPAWLRPAHVQRQL